MLSRISLYLFFNLDMNRPPVEKSVGNLSTRDTDSRLSRLGSQGQTSDCLRLNTYPKDAHLGITRPVRHAYLTWSSEPHEGVGDAPVYCSDQQKSRYLLHPVVDSLAGTDA